MTAPRPLPSQDRLRELFDYDPVSGILTWRRRDDIDPGFNGRFAGKPAGSLCGRGWKVMVDHRSLLYHRVIWKWTYGAEPPEVDHINGNVSDNRLANLRAATRLLNGKNRGPNKGKKLPKGVTLGSNCVNYEAKIVANGIKEIIGYFATPEAAHQAYLEAADARFGEWARAGVPRREFSRARKKRAPPSDETRAKISATLMGRKIGPLSDAHRAALSASLKGKKRSPLSEEHKALLSQVRKGKPRLPFSAEWKEAIAAGQRGKKRGPPSAEVKARRRAGLLAYYRQRKDDIQAGGH
jgi:hypothetical protein